MDESCDDDRACAELSCSKKEKFYAFLSKMNLADKYPQKLSLRDAMTVRQETLGTVHTTDQPSVLPYLILQKIMMCDQRCRSCLFKMSPSTMQSDPTGSDTDSELSDSDYDGDLDVNSLHPVDCILSLLHCCDDILRQELFNKLSLCQLAIPFLLPNPTDDSVTFLLWAMRSLFRGWKCHRTDEQEHRIVDYQGAIVSFIRIGDSQSSKSEILNAVIGRESEYFFNCRVCEGGDRKRNFVNGLVEMCCYLPSGKDTDWFTDSVTFLNLRGDAQQHLKQVEFMQKISFTSVVLTAEEYIHEGTVTLLQHLSEAPGGIILLLVEDKQHKKETKGSHSKNLDLLRQALPKSKCSKVKLRNKNMAALSKDLQQLLAQKLNNAAPEQFKSISSSCEFAKKVGIKIDEDNKDSEVGKRYAEIIMKNVKSVQVKDKMLPLQSPSLWHKWAKSNKERYRQARRKQETSVTEYNAEKDREKMEIRKKQLDQCTSLTPVMDYFIQYLLETNVNIRKYYLQWLKLFLDDHSRKKLPELHLHVQEIKNKLKTRNEELINASFGLEHLLREIGQICEVTMDCGGYEVPQTLQDKTNRLPQLMAEIMDEGHALELMDGDASHVPTLWVLAVIEKLKAVCGKNAREKNGGKIFVLSIVGVQSTGKSTLLNTMFGLRFNVSAGRCTRGAYIQLLPLNDSLRQMIDCDYVLIVDTEGLRAPELQLGGLKHDNELATFVIGVADATIINLSGEAPGDIDDILQTSLHAFIRMRKIELSPHCMFVHQNVTDVLASSKSDLGRQKFYSKLDVMTQAAAKVESCEGQYYSFSQVIDFDDRNDVFYFPSLWKGDPPMAPVNISYSESAQTLKTALIKLMQRKQTCWCSLETFKLRVNNLWSAVIQENFVFSFKNTLEVSAYNELNHECAQWSRMLQNKMLEWENTTKNKMNCNCKTTDQIKEEKETCLKEAEKKLTETHKEILEKMESFLNSSDHSETLSRWKNDSEKRIKELHDESKKQANKHCDDLEKKIINSHEANELVENSYTELDDKIEELVDLSWRSGIQYNDDELKVKFEDTWKKWMIKFEKEIMKVVTYPTDYAIETAIVKGLRELQVDEKIIISKLTEKPFNTRRSSLTLDDLNKEVHQYLSSTRWCGFKTIGNSDVQLAAKLTENYLTTARKCLDEARDELKPFNPSFVCVVLQDLLSSVDDLTKPEKKSNFAFTPEYKVDMALTVCVYASDVFKEITKIKKQDEDPIVNFNKRKDIYLNDFILKYKKEDNNKRAAIKVYKLLIGSIKDAVKASIPLEIANELQSDLPQLRNTRSLKIQILKDLAYKDNSELYRVFLFDIPGCFHYWIDHYIDNCSTGTVTGPAQRELSTVKEKVNSTINEVCTVENTNIDGWINEYTNRLCGILPHINKAEIKASVKECDIDAFLKYFKKELRNMKYELQSEFNNARSIISTLNYSCANPPHKLLYDRLIGCTHKCPFCQEQCDATCTNGTHSGKHSVSIHRPQCLGTYSNVDSKKLVVYICTESPPDDTFQCQDTGWKPVKYCNYNTIYPDWYIPSAQRYEPKYWQWYICKHMSDVIKWASASGVDIPPQWHYITKSEAIYSLEQYTFGSGFFSGLHALFGSPRRLY